MRSRILKTIAGAGILLIALTGCVDVKNTVDIKNDGTATIASQVLIKNSYLEQAEMTPDQYLASMPEELSNENITYKNIKTDTATGTLTTRKVIWEGEKADFGTKETNKLKENKDFPTIMERSGNDIIISFPFALNESETDFPSYKSFENSGVDTFDMSVTFPGKVKEASHGGKIDGNKVTWNLANVSKAVAAKEVITATGSSGAGSGIPLITIGIMAFMVLGGAGFFAWKILKKRKEDKDSDNYIDELEKQHAPAIAELKRQAAEKEKQDLEASQAYVQVPQTPQKAVYAPLPSPKLPMTTPPIKPQTPASSGIAAVRPPIPKLPPLPPLPPRR